jgi:hypothetical protein
MRTTAANVAARQAVGGSDMLSKWQLMAEQARQKRAPVPRPSNISGKVSAEHNEASKRSHFAAFGAGKEAFWYQITFTFSCCGIGDCFKLRTQETHTPTVYFRRHETAGQGLIRDASLAWASTNCFREGRDLRPGEGATDDEIAADLSAVRAIAWRF